MKGREWGGKSRFHFSIALVQTERKREILQNQQLLIQTVGFLGDSKIVKVFSFSFSFFGLENLLHLLNDNIMPLLCGTCKLRYKLIKSPDGC